MSYLIFGEDVGNFFLFEPYDLRSLSTCQMSSVLSQNLILELLKVLYSFSFILLLYKPPLFSFLPCLGLCYLPHLLSSTLNIAGFCHLFQVGLKPLLFFMPSLSKSQKVDLVFFYFLSHFIFFFDFIFSFFYFLKTLGFRVRSNWSHQ